MNKEFLKNPPKKYRPSPFWSWNERLNAEETRLQVQQMEQAGMGGYFMHARGGLQTEYMSDEWFDNVYAAVDEGKKLGMLAWGYDENGWPSGFGGGAVNGLGEKYQQKYLVWEKTDAPKQTEHTIINLTLNGENLHFYYELNPFYVDTLNGEVIDEFIRATHQAYFDTMGEKFQDMAGFFTDEPQVSRAKMPWSLILEREYQAAYGEPLAPLLPALFFVVDGYRRVRYNYWKLIRDLFTDNFMGRIYAWCQSHGSKLTGHAVIEEYLAAHIRANGCCLPSYEFMDIPGMDHLGRSQANIQTEIQVASVANQLGKKQILSETFALCGWNVSFEDLRSIYEGQMVHGVNYLCQHLEGYSLRGIRKRDYPASLFRHQPWWPEYRTFNDMVSRIGMLVAEGQVNYDVLVLHIVESGWIHFDIEMMRELELGVRESMNKVLQILDDAQIQFHLGDGRIMQRHGSVTDGKIHIGTQSYSTVVVPPSLCFGKNTYDMLVEFKAQGGTLIFVENLPRYIDGIETDAWKELGKGALLVGKNMLVENIPAHSRRIELTYPGKAEEPMAVGVRDFAQEDMTMYYIVNRHPHAHNITAKVKGGSATIFDATTGEEVPAQFTANDGMLTLTAKVQAKGSVIFFVYNNTDHAPAKEECKSLRPLGSQLQGEWSITSADPNAITLDYCDLYFEGELVAEQLPINDVQEKACAFGRKVDTKVVYRFEVKEDAFKECKLVVETPEIFDITVNGQPVEKKVLGCYHDTAFKVIDIRQYVKSGTNEVTLRCDFEQSAETYEKIKKAPIFESEKNKLSYDMEIEAAYIIGDFGVYTENAFTPSDNRGLITKGEFYLGKAKTKVHPGALAPQGYPFFAGTMTFEKTIELSAEDCTDRVLQFSNLCSNVTKVKVNGQDAGKIFWQPYQVDLSGLLQPGKNTIEVTVLGNLRNLLGPFHLERGECLSVGPTVFFHESPIWRGDRFVDWADTYAFVEYGLFLA